MKHIVYINRHNGRLVGPNYPNATAYYSEAAVRRQLESILLLVNATLRRVTSAPPIDTQAAINNALRQMQEQAEQSE